MDVLDKVYDSLYAPGPILRWGSFIVGGYIGLSIVAVVAHKLRR